MDIRLFQLHRTLSESLTPYVAEVFNKDYLLSIININKKDKYYVIILELCAILVNLIDNDNNEAGCNGNGITCKLIKYKDNDYLFTTEIVIPKEDRVFQPKDRFTDTLSAISSKISQHKEYDKKRFGIIGNIKKEDVIDLLDKQQFRCYVCDDIVLTYNWKPRCLYQFSLDRIDNSLPHNRDNVLISCYYCNCIKYMTNRTECSENTKHKICDNNCHCDKRQIQIKREDVSIDKINLLKLN
tara:strand:- start:154 stop:876 length:723 start_codon:yes stop_codon:yes gene_type:complete